MNDIERFPEGRMSEMKWFEASAEWVLIETRGSYATYTRNLGNTWHWVLVSNGKIIQDGCSISFHTAKRSLDYALKNALKGGDLESLSYLWHGWKPNETSLCKNA